MLNLHSYSFPGWHPIEYQTYINLILTQHAAS